MLAVLLLVINLILARDTFFVYNGYAQAILHKEIATNVKQMTRFCVKNII